MQTFDIVKIGDATLYHADCRDVLPTLPRFDLLLTDPPYGIFKKDGGNGMMFGKETIYSVDDTASTWDARPDTAMLEMIRQSGKKWIIWGGNYFAADLGDCPGILIWNKKTGNNSYADGECAFSNVTGTMRIFTHQWCGAFKDSERGLRAEHPTQKPAALMEWCLSLHPKAETVLDPFMGSGTTGVACAQSGRSFTGIERERKYFDIAVERISRAYAQGKLFDDKNMQQVLNEQTSLSV